MAPYIPAACGGIFHKLATKPKFLKDLSPNFDNLKAGTKVSVGAILFQKIESDEDMAAKVRVWVDGSSRLVLPSIPSEARRGVGPL